MKINHNLYIVLLAFANFLLPTFSFAQTIALGNSPFSLAVCNDNTVMAWGYNTYGQLGNGTTTDTFIFVQVSDLSAITAVSAGWYHSLSLKNDGTIA